MTARQALRASLITTALLLFVGVRCGADDSWYTTWIDGQRAGWLHEQQRRLEEQGRELVLSSSETRLKLRRFGTPLDLESSTHYWETPDGEPVRFSSRTLMSGQAIEMQGRVEADGLHLTTRTPGSTQRRVVPWNDEILFPAELERRFRQARLEPGQQLRVQTFAPELARPTWLVVRAIGVETVELPELGQRRLQRYELELDALPGVTIVEWRDSHGEEVAELTPMLGVEIVSVRSSQGDATVPSEIPELLTATLLDPGARLADATRVELLRYRVRGPEGLELPADERQQPLRLADGSLLVSLRPERWSHSTQPPPGPEYLAPSPLLQSDDPLVRRLAREASGSEPHAAAQARAITEWVHGAIEHKGMGLGLASAREVAEQLEGDCTEHAMLTAALARSRGIPARLASGLVYVDGLLGYHMWTELWVDGGWRAVDAIFGETAANATHLKLSDSALSESFMDEGLARLVALVAELEVTIVDWVERLPDGGWRWVNPGRGLSLVQPAGTPLPEALPANLPPASALVEWTDSDGGRAALHADSPRDRSEQSLWHKLPHGLTIEYRPQTGASAPSEQLASLAAALEVEQPRKPSERRSR